MIIKIHNINTYECINVLSVQMSVSALISFHGQILKGLFVYPTQVVRAKCPTVCPDILLFLSAFVISLCIVMCLCIICVYTLLFLYIYNQCISSLTSEPLVH